MFAVASSDVKTTRSVPATVMKSSFCSKSGVSRESGCLSDQLSSHLPWTSMSVLAVMSMRYSSSASARAVIVPLPPYT